MKTTTNFTTSNSEVLVQSEALETLISQIPDSMARLKSLVRARVTLMTPQNITAFVPILREEVERILNGQSDVEKRILAILGESSAANDEKYSLAA